MQIGDTLRNINVGGGLGIIHRPEHPSSMTIADWAQSIKTCLALPIRESNKVYLKLFICYTFTDNYLRRMFE